MLTAPSIDMVENEEANTALSRRRLGFNDIVAQPNLPVHRSQDHHTPEEFGESYYTARLTLAQLPSRPRPHFTSSPSSGSTGSSPKDDAAKRSEVSAKTFLSDTVEVTNLPPCQRMRLLGLPLKLAESGQAS